MRGAGGEPIQLFCATSNPGKLKEFQHAAGEGFEIHGLSRVDCPEEGATFEENAVAKALCYSQSLKSSESSVGAEPLLVFGDDSGLSVEALNGEPGVHSARFAGPEADDRANNALLLARLAGRSRSERRARFVCSIALVRQGEFLQSFQGDVEGLILDRAVGTGGFGYDPLFFFPHLGKTFAQLSLEEKWRHSHRGRAFRRLLEWLRRRTADESSSVR